MFFVFLLHNSGVVGGGDEDDDMRKSKQAPKKKLFSKAGEKERITERARFLADSALALAKAPDNLVIRNKVCRRYFDNIKSVLLLLF